MSIDCPGFAIDGLPLRQNRWGTAVIDAGVVTGNDSFPAESITHTWNTSGQPTAHQINIIDFASDAGSFFANWRINGTSRFSVTKRGFITSAVEGYNGPTDTNRDFFTGTYGGTTVCLLRLDTTSGITSFSLTASSAGATLYAGGGGSSYNTTFWPGLYGGSSYPLTIYSSASALNNASIIFQAAIGSPNYTSAKLGIVKLTADNTGYFAVNQNSLIGFTPDVGLSSLPDISFSRNNAGVIEVNSGIRGDYRDLITRNQTLTGSAAIAGTLSVTSGPPYVAFA